MLLITVIICITTLEKAKNIVIGYVAKRGGRLHLEKVQLAVGVGFEPTVPFDTIVFKTIRINHSRIPPCFLCFVLDNFSMFLFGQQTQIEQTPYATLPNIVKIGIDFGGTTVGISFTHR